jgi:hypothetical protein
MKQNIEDVEKAEDFDESQYHKEAIPPEHLDQTPKTANDSKRLEFVMNADRTHIDFNCELNSLLKHEENFTRPRL